MARRYLKIVYDVTGLTDAEVGCLELEAVVQAERSKPFDDASPGHPDVPVVETTIFDDEEAA